MLGGEPDRGLSVRGRNGGQKDWGSGELAVSELRGSRAALVLHPRSMRTSSYHGYLGAFLNAKNFVLRTSESHVSAPRYDDGQALDGRLAK